MFLNSIVVSRNDSGKKQICKGRNDVPNQKRPAYAERFWKFYLATILFHLSGFGNGDLATAEFVTVEGFNGFLRAFCIRHFDEAEAAALASELIGDHSC